MSKKRHEKLSKKNAGQVVLKIIDIANAWVDEHRSEWKGDVNMLHCAYSDAADMLAIARLIEGAKFDEAVKETWKLDTIVREGMPEELFLYTCLRSQNEQS